MNTRREKTEEEETLIFKKKMLERDLWQTKQTEKKFLVARTGYNYFARKSSYTSTGIYREK